ncbi:uncharacterized protein FFB20_14876 [Fusarium fujikuroi]|nr:Uncharacterized protein Y057_7546 [Fusarium fujikuroi]SCO15931.1 uncharacterized protein FFB20_14876 [Fusarium fujikuroi]SCO20694.1 uncharacterized protein FFC1_13807 [Fusarium fujikuroi]SCO45502.1 uncharacterized protein FFNC_10327 [Fusarium fujikuroi]VTT83131.1 unnamed protein product [Fusarium fujikuroi]
MSSEMLSELRNFLALFAEKAPEGESQARFGHVQVPPYRLGEVSLMEYIRQDLVKGGCPDMTFFVVPEVEKALGTGVEEDDLTPSVVLTFSDLLEALQATKRMAPLGEDWGFNNPKWALDGWREHKLLPISIVLVLCLDPQMPSTCALSLIGIVKWATEMSLDLDSDIRVLTMSAEKDFNFLSNLVSFTAPGVNVATLNLAAHGEVDPIQRCEVPRSSEVSLYADGILNRMRTDSESRRLIVSFNVEFSKTLEGKMAKDERQLLKAVYMDPATTFKPLVELENSTKGFKTSLLTVRGEMSSLPPILSGYDEIHVIPGSSDAMRTEWDDRRCQMVVSSHSASQEDRQLQCWWIQQASIPSRFIYPGQAPQAFFNAGGPRLRLVENAELGGFLVGVIDCASWGIDVGKAVACFVRQISRTQEMVERLDIQRLINNDGLNLFEDEAVTFRAVLPALGFDHRLAMLVAFDSGPSVRRVKVQLACMLKLGLVHRINSNVDALNKPEQYKELLDGCHGIGRSLAERGAMWLALGLIKNHLRNAELNGGYDKSKDALKKLVSIKQQDASNFNTEVRKVLRLMSEKGISVDASESIAAEEDQLSSGERHVLHLHLLRAFLYQFSVIPLSEAANMVNTNLATLAESRFDKLARLTDLKSISQREGGYVYGVSHEYVLRGESVPLDASWTSIPRAIVAECQLELRSDMNIHEVLSTGIQHS